jgi:hypothetical protein
MGQTVCQEMAASPHLPDQGRALTMVKLPGASSSYSHSNQKYIFNSLRNILMDSNKMNSKKHFKIDSKNSL